jgi:hypothetical protein
LTYVSDVPGQRPYEERGIPSPVHTPVRAGEPEEPVARRRPDTSRPEVKRSCV